jgi:hypothetical protein
MVFKKTGYIFQLGKERSDFQFDCGIHLFI